MCFVFGSFAGALFVLLVQNVKKSKKLTTSSSKSTPPAASAPVIYEEVSPDTGRKNDIELNENVAYGPVSTTNIQ